MYLLLPNRIFSFIPEPIYCGPQNYSSEFGDGIRVCELGGLDSTPTYFRLTMTFILDSRPKTGSSKIFSTSSPNRGLSLDVDFLGTLYLRIGSSTDPLIPEGDGSQLVKASDPFDTGKPMTVDILYRKVTNQFSLKVAGEDRVLFQNEAGKSEFSARRILPDLSYVELGGQNNLGFDGSISNFNLSSSFEDSRGTTRELKSILIIMGVMSFLVAISYRLATKNDETLVD